MFDMSMRITSDNIDKLPPWAREQLEQHLDAPYDAERPDKPPKRPAKAINRPEEDAGRMLTTWIDLLVMPNGLRPGLFFYHVPNGLARTAAQGGIFKAQGLRKGWPDYGLDLPLGPYHGLRGELKGIDGDKPSALQLDILARLEAVGFKCCVWWGFDHARRDIEQYLDLAH